MPIAKSQLRALQTGLVEALLVLLPASLHAQNSSFTPVKAPEIPAQIELLETLVRFEANGDSRKEVHTRVRIHNELGIRQFARLNFDYNRGFQQIEIPMVRITHAAGGTADILPSAITDNPNAAVVNYPAYHDVRVKSVRILGLAPNDLLEYRVITSTTHHPLAPDFWLEHTFERTGVVSDESFELTVPASRKIKLYTSSSSPASVIDESGDGQETGVTYRWKRSSGTKQPEESSAASPTEADIVATSYETWAQLSRNKMAVFFGSRMVNAPEITAKATELTRDTTSAEAKVEAIYDFVSKKIALVDLPMGATGYRTREPAEVLAAGYGTAEDKIVLFSSLLHSADARSDIEFAAATPPKLSAEFARPSVFDHVLVSVDSLPNRWLDPSLGVTPYGMIASQLRGLRALRIYPPAPPDQDAWRVIPDRLPFPAKQDVEVDAALAADGTLASRVKYTMRGDNELLLRVAFHQSPRDKWKDVAQLLALSDGFRGKITRATASDPYATKEPFTVEYEITQPKFVDWSKKPVRIPALLPLLGLPDPPEKSAAGAGAAKIELGTPLDVLVSADLHLPPGTSAEVPTGTSVDRDYATYSSKYGIQGGIISASRHINFIQREIPGDRFVDYNAFLHAVQTDQSQLFSILRQDPATPAKP